MLWRGLQVGSEMIRSELAKARPRAGESDTTRQVLKIASTWLPGRSAKRGKFELKSNRCATCQTVYVMDKINAVCWGCSLDIDQQNQNRDQSPEAAIGVKPSFWQEADGGSAISSIESLAFALNHTRSLKRIFTLCSSLELEKLRGTEPGFALRSTISQPATS